MPETLAPTTVLPRARLRLEFVRPVHAPRIQALAGDPRLARYTRLPHPYPGDGAIIFVRESMEGRITGREVVFAIMECGELRGVCGVQEINANARTADLGYWVDPDHWGQGIATEAARAACGFAFQHLGLQLLTACHAVRNEASGRVMRKIGFRATHTRPDDRLGETLYYELIPAQLHENQELVVVEIAPGEFR